MIRLQKAFRHFIRLGAMLLLVAHQPLWADPEPLRVGIVPYLTANVLMTLFQPVRQHLEKGLGQPVELFTAADVKTFVKRTQRPDFDLVITAAHQARLAQLDGGYLPLARFSGPLHAALAVASDAGLRGLTDLRGKRVAITDRSILVNIAMLQILAEQGIAEKDLILVPVNSQNNAILAVTRGDADAAIIAHFTLDQIPQEQKAGIRLLYRSPALPNITLLAKSTLKPEVRQRLQQTLLSLPATGDGAAFLEKSRFQGIVAADERFMKTLDIYLTETRRQLAP